ncbi:MULTISPECIES: hypothetical protein [Aphanizomenon]|uniref:hypothetical protein n=1 Tax=Aphanizomenon TaxID=1175 RepID=UPI000541F683|nr:MULTISPECIES: hypothetical protein [Aphanizomenon]KHG41847.1 hypothetical protein OA07_08840 [Aphanizomenon flos-aquae 2012/KM1/D3]MTJ28497.1 hypothetical protein [Aphanizomenon sp. UHCC 0183]QSV71260.1 MAG: hypothetical protein HEQ20_11430 [Aphanizomenon flos-aquae KM1D3_PB]
MEKNHHSITIIPDEYFYEMLQRIKQRPGMFLGQCSITRLRAFLDGYMGSRSDLGLPPTQQELEFNQFQEWVQRRFKISSSHGWDSIILFYSADERDALNNFFELFEQFCNSESATREEMNQEKFTESNPQLTQERVTV